MNCTKCGAEAPEAVRAMFRPDLAMLCPRCVHAATAPHPGYCRRTGQNRDECDCTPCVLGAVAVEEVLLAIDGFAEMVKMAGTRTADDGVKRAREELRERSSTASRQRR